MTDHYQVLGLSPRADGDAIKVAYRTLAKRYHPDLKAGDATAVQRFKDITEAYQTLNHPSARAEYDSERSAARRRFWRGAAAGSVSFVVLTCAFVLLVPGKVHLTVGKPQATASAVAPEGPEAAVQLRTPRSLADGSAAGAREPVASSAGQEPAPDAPEPPKSAKVPAEGARVATLPRMEPTLAVPPADAPSAPAHTVREPQIDPVPAPAAAAVPARPKPLQWTFHHNARFGFTLRFPGEVFTAVGDAAEGDDRLLVSGDGRAVIRISSAATAAGATVDSYRQSLIAQRYAGATLDDAPRRGNWFVLSGTMGRERFYQHVTFSCDRRSIHGWLLVYPVGEREFYAAIIEEMLRSYRYEHAPSAGCDSSRPELAKF